MFVQQEVAKAAQSILEYPPMQAGASFNLEQLKKMLAEKAAQHGNLSHTDGNAYICTRYASLLGESLVAPVLNSPLVSVPSLNRLLHLWRINHG